MPKQAHVTVAAVIEKDGRFLLVEERIGDDLVLNQPAGHWENHETLERAVRREVLEEAAWDVEPAFLVGIYEYAPPELDYSFLRFAYAARALRHHPHRALDAGVVRAVWLSRAEIAREAVRHRSPMVLRCVDDYLSGRRIPLSAVAHLVPQG